MTRTAAERIDREGEPDGQLARSASRSRNYLRKIDCGKGTGLEAAPDTGRGRGVRDPAEWDRATRYDHA